MHKLQFFFGLLALCFIMSQANAENATRHGNITIHHNAFMTVDLSPQMASQYGIKRSSNRAMVNISLVKQDAKGKIQGIEANVKVIAKNLRGQVRQIPLRQVKEENAVYYIGEFLVENQERIQFTVEAQPKGSEQRLHAQFEQQFFTH